ncbi:MULTISPECIES: N-acetylmuramoyl-L-alanine amidase [unclassified Streptomyces]|uniref:N-acetylmuramoyl-L-alanine amidase n=1 Tax=unclassified Streptomyces TaxID=2593676 RepID=UPI00081DCB73|nr:MULTISPECIES: N-acetylmuramoyl-L-alanine amidase [unclassified Streptomyces]MYR28622.1 N-acetylmuramoyl-L-alanine amidase [Streptomyces sp. SID4945]SCF39702.1 N-acetylmuramoyl-L-alanine amidase [Streptomyces sp. LcepLS]
MATPLSADRLLSALRAEGVTVVEHAGWRSHNRNAVGAWGPVNGVLIHHTAGTSSAALVYGGRADLPGPLAHTHLAKSGVATMMSAGRANHAGKAAKNSFDAVVAEAATHPKPSASTGTVDGNTHFYGIEIENLGNGRDPYPAVQYEAAVRWAAAICRAHGWGANSVVGHKETSVEGKIDPSFDMNTFRRDVAARLAGPASAKPPKTTTPSTPTEEDPMAGITKADIYDAVWKTDKVPAPDTSTTIKTNPTWAPVSVLRDIANNVRAIRAAEAGQTAAITALAKLVGTGVDTAAVVSAVEAAIADAVIDVNINTPKES